ncbi:hypothetical protein ABZP36_031272 [Zizania latifolia]
MGISRLVLVTALLVIAGAAGAAAQEEVAAAVVAEEIMAGEKGSVAAEEQIVVSNLFLLWIDKLKKDIEAHNGKKATLENKANVAEKKVQELTAKIDALQKANDEQKRKLQNTERALKVAEEELMRVHLEATTKSKQLTEVHGALLPPWLAAHSARYMVKTEPQNNAPVTSSTYLHSQSLNAIIIVLYRSYMCIIQTRFWYLHQHIVQFTQYELKQPSWITCTNMR